MSSVIFEAGLEPESSPVPLKPLFLLSRSTMPGSPKIIERIYHNIFPLVKSGGCFINFDRERPPIGRPDEMAKGRRFSGCATFLDG